MTLRHINIRWRQIWCFRKGNRKEKVVTLCITPFNVEQTTCIVCYAFSAFSLIATHLNDPVSVCYPDWMDEGKLGKREQKIKKIKRLPNTWMHQPEGQKDKCKSSCTAVIKKSALLMHGETTLCPLSLQPQLEATLELCLWWPTWQREVCKVTFSSLTRPVLKHASSKRSPGARSHTLCWGFPTDWCNLPK